jgi:hypothetical protein
MSCSRPRVIVGECGEVPFFGRNQAFPVGKPLQRSHSSSECISARSFWLASRPEQWACMDTRCADVGFNFARSPLTPARREGKVKANAASYTDGCAGSVPCRQWPSRYSIVCGKKPSTLRPSSDGSYVIGTVLREGALSKRSQCGSLRMESGSKQLDWAFESNLHPFFGSCRGSGVGSNTHTRSLGCLVNPLALSSACWEGVSAEHGGAGSRPVRSRWEALSASSVANYLVDPASSHMLVSKIKPCMSKYKLLIL